MAEIIKSGLTGKEYNLSHVIRIINIYQATYYCSNGVMPVDIYVSKDFNTNKPILVFLFDKAKTKELYVQWIERKQDKEVYNV